MRVSESKLECNTLFGEVQLMKLEFIGVLSFEQ